MLVWIIACEAYASSLKAFCTQPLAERSFHEGKVSILTSQGLSAWFQRPWQPGLSWTLFQLSSPYLGRPPPQPVTAYVTNADPLPAPLSAGLIRANKVSVCGENMRILPESDYRKKLLVCFWWEDNTLVPTDSGDCKFRHWQANLDMERAACLHLDCVFHKAEQAV